MPLFPQAVPEIPVANVEVAADYYVKALGFSFDWGDDPGGIGGISQGDCRMFLTNTSFRGPAQGTQHVTIWLNLGSRDEVDELHARWKESGAKLLSDPEDKPWNLREFTATDIDGNRLRVFYDFSREIASSD
jgi:predicted lactoylglutathione lyase